VQRQQAPANLGVDGQIHRKRHVTIQLRARKAGSFVFKEIQEFLLTDKSFNRNENQQKTSVSHLSIRQFHGNLLKMKQILFYNWKSQYFLLHKFFTRKKEKNDKVMSQIFVKSEP
jgi:hypothetical protein